eukprot:3946594-Amphidinium_carterae.1
MMELGYLPNRNSILLNFRDCGVPFWVSGSHCLRTCDLFCLALLLAAEYFGCSASKQDGWNKYVKDMWKESPKKIYMMRMVLPTRRMIRLNFAKVELGAWSKLWRPGTPQL